MKLLVVVDMQNDFIEGSLGSSEARRIVPAVNNKIREYRKHCNQIIFTRDTHDEQYLNTQEGRNLPIVHCQINTYGWQITQDLAIQEDDIIINKSSFACDWPSCFSYKSGLSDCSEIEIVGLCTDICVISNALVLKSLLPEIPITVDAACCAGTTPQAHASALEIMKMCHIKLMNQE